MLTLKKYVGYKYTLNHEIVNVALSKRQASDCDVKCHILFSAEVSCIRFLITVGKPDTFLRQP